MITNHDHIILIAMALGFLLGWPLGYWRGLEVGKIRGRIEYRNIQRWKREG